MNGENLEEWKQNQRFTIKQLIQNDRLENETLKNVIKQVEQRFAANDSSDKSFEEIFKLIFLKLYDEISSSKNADEIAILMKHNETRLLDIDDSSFRVMEFRVHENESLDDLFKRISSLFEDAKKKWSGIFPDKSKIDMQPETLKSCIRELQNVKLFNSNLEVVDDAFEYLVNKNQKEEMGQYFTPRYIIDMCVKMLNPHENEKMIDTAAGSCGFPMHTIFNVWQKINPDSNNLFTTTARSNEELEYVRNNVFGIDFSEKSVRVGRMLNIIAGDGHTNVIELNSLDYTKWNKAYLSNRDWQAKYNEGFSKIERLETANSKDRYSSFDFDILMANPPFAGDIDNKEQLEPYKLAHKFEEGKPPKVKNKVGRDVLFIERNLNFLKPGGRMAIVLPQGRFNNSSDKEIRDFICEQCRILAVVGLHGNVFKPHTGTKTSVLFVQKWDNELCPKTDDYPIFFATMQEPSKDNSGDKIYVTEDYVKCTKLTYENIKNEKGKIVALPPEEETLKTEDGNDIFVKDLFVQQNGDVNSHKKWIKDNINFIVKQNRKKKVKKDEISIDEWLSLDKETQKFYKKNPLEGKNKNSEIGLKEWEALSKEEKKFYLESSRVKEWTERVKDTHGHIFVKHDLFNHDPNLENKNPNKPYCQDGIAEAFQEFAKREGLSFFQ